MTAKTKKTPTTAKPAKAPLPTKADFVRENLKLPTAEIVAKGKKIGLKIDPKVVYVYRSKANTAKATATPKSGAPAGDAATHRLVGIASELGLGRAIDILKGERERVLRLFEDAR